MFFQINITPKEKKAPTQPLKDAQKETVFSLKLAPFQPQTRINLESTINTPTQCFVQLQNNTKSRLSITISKEPPTERGVSFSFKKASIEPENFTTLEITWCPKENGSWRENVQITDNRKIKYDVALNMHTITKTKKLNTRKPVPEAKTKSSKWIANKENIQTSTPLVTVSQPSPKGIFEEFQTKILSPDGTQEFHCRRATYLTTPMFIKNVTYTEVKSDNEQEEFEDSLSPLEPAKSEQEEKVGQSDFSMIMNNIELTRTPSRLKSENVERNTHAVLESPKNAANNTFNINDRNSDGARGSFDRLRPTRLSQTFEASSPIMSEIFEQRSYNSSSQKPPPISLQSSPYRSCVKTIDPGSAKDVVEANLWSNGDSQKRQFSYNITKDESMTFHHERTQTTKKKFNPRSLRLDSPLELVTEETSTTEIIKETRTDIIKKQHTLLKLEISPPKRMIGTIPRKISPTKRSKVLKDKAKETPASLRKKVQRSTNLKCKNVSIPGVRISKLSLAKFYTNKGEKNGNSDAPTSVRNVQKVQKVQDCDDFFTKLWNPDPFAATTTSDPFLTGTLYHNERWIQEQELAFKKWLNVLLTPPEQLSTNDDTLQVDIGTVWQSCRLKEDVLLAESRETVSARFHTNTRLNTLRKAAAALYRSEEVSKVLTSTTSCIEKGTLTIRPDRDLHRDIGLQKEILHLLLSYNPLWLRIGLETVYGERIPLHSNTDLVGLTRFLLGRFFSDPFIVKSHSQGVSNIRLPTFTPQMNKFILKKFLYVVYFMDYAKTKKLIGHNPCLFRKKSSYKDTRSILLSFSRELLAGIGDITKVLRLHGYTVQHSQKYLDEFDYAVIDLSTDLKDGVRLCRLMELITAQKNLTSSCRVPAISRLQKIHNVKISLNALNNFGYNLAGDIDAKSIVDGHREKTLSLLWQIIYRVQAPKFEKAAKVIQRWWRALSYWIRARNLVRNYRNKAAIIIQTLWRSYSARKYLANLKETRKREIARENYAALVIQTRWRDRKRNLAATVIQRNWRKYYYTRNHVLEFKRTKLAVVKIQKGWRKYKKGRTVRNEFLILRNSAITIQRFYRSRKLVKDCLNNYRELRNAVIFVQRKFRAKRIRENYLNTLRSVKKVQNCWRNYAEMKRCRKNYEKTRNSCIKIQRWYRSVSLMKSERENYLKLKSTTIDIQIRWKSIRNMRKDREKFLQTRNATVTIQNYWRGYLAMREAREKYLRARESIIFVQNYYRLLLLSKRVREDFLKKKAAAICIQRQFRAYREMRRVRTEYLETKVFVLKIQRIWRSILAARELSRREKSAVKIQKCWKMYRQRKEYVKIRKAVIYVQRKWRSIVKMREERSKFLRLKRSVVYIENRWDSILEMREARADFITIRKSVVCIQKYWRGWKQMLVERKSFNERKLAVSVIENHWKSVLLMREKRTEFLRMKIATIQIQKRWRQFLETRRLRKDYLEKRRSAICIQTHWRAFVAMREERTRYLAMKRSVALIENYRASILLTRKCRNEFIETKMAVIIIQRSFKRFLEAKRIREEFVQIRNSVVIIQRKWRAQLQMKKERKDYIQLRNSAILVQNYWRSKKKTQKIRSDYERLRSRIILIQQKWRSLKITRTQREEFLKLRNSAVVVQRAFKNYNNTKTDVNRFRSIVKSTIIIQRYWRTILEAREIREHYLKLKTATIFIQREWRLKMQIRQASEVYMKEMRILKRVRHFMAATKIQIWWRSIKDVVLKEREAAVKIQSIWRGYRLRRSQDSEIVEIRQRCEKATLEAIPSNTLKCRFDRIIQIFRNCNTVGQELVCMKALDGITRLTKSGCVAVCKLNLIDRLYGFLHLANRSGPYMDLSLTTTSVLLTIAKFHVTRHYVAEPKYADIILTLMNKCIEIRVDVFLHLATLFWIFIQDPNYVKMVLNHRTKWIIKTLSQKVAKMEQQAVKCKSRSRAPTQLDKTLMRLNESCDTASVLPNKKNDWGLTNNNKPRTFLNARQAVATIMNILNIDDYT